jgi:hypothetical protein
MSSGTRTPSTPYAHYPPNIPTDPALIAQLHQAAQGVEGGFQRVDQAFQEVGGALSEVRARADERTQMNYERLVALTQQQAEDAARHRQAQEEQFRYNQQLVEQLQEQRQNQQELIRQLEEQRAITAAHNQALHEASAASIAQRRDLDEVLRRRVSARWPVFQVPPAEVIQPPLPREPIRTPSVVQSPPVEPTMRADWHVPMPPTATQYSYQTHEHLPNQPAMAIGFTEVPKAPKYSGCTKLDMRRFMDDYQAYSREVTLLNAACGSAKISLMPVAACIDPRAMERLCYWEFDNRSYHEITEQDWRNFFASARDTE